MISFAHASDRLAAALGGGPAARLAACALVEADALGMPRFGIAMLDEWSPDLLPFEAGGITAAVHWIDGSSVFAPLAVAGATLDIAAAARQSGIAAIFLRGIRGFGRLAPFVRHLADQGLLGIAAAEGPPFVAPYGGTAPVIGTNPFALGLGRGTEQVVVDFATSGATMADIRGARASGEPLPAGIAVDANGQQTSVAADVAALLPRGGAIGSLLGLVVELLAGVAGAGRGDQRGRGVFILALDPSLAGTSVDMQQRLAELKHAWVGGGGYWPGGRRVEPTALLDDDFEQRLDESLAAMARQAGA